MEYVSQPATNVMNLKLIQHILPECINFKLTSHFAVTTWLRVPVYQETADRDSVTILNAKQLMSIHFENAKKLNPIQ